MAILNGLDVLLRLGQFEAGLLALSLASLLAIPAAIIAGLLYLLVRLTGALSTQANRIWPPLIPGLIIFLLFGEPAIEFAFYRTNPGAYSALYLAGIIAGSLLASALLIYWFPVFRGMNIHLLFVSALAARVALFPAYQTLTDAGEFLFFLLSVNAAWISIFLALQQHHRLQLSPYYERFIVPRRLIFAVSALYAICAVCYIYFNLQTPDFISYTKNGLIQREWIYDIFPWTTVLVALAYWLLGSLQLQLHNRNSGISFKMPAYGLALLCAIALLVTLTRLDKTRHAAALLNSAGPARELLTLSSFFIKGSHDCQECNASTTAIEYNSLQGRDSETIFIVTAIDFQPDQARKSGYFLQPGRDPGRTLHRMFRLLQNSQDAELKTIFSLYTEAGYRTICVGSDGNYDYFKIQNSLRLDSGCQIFSPLPPGLSVDQHYKAAISNYWKYKTKRNIVWLNIHTSEKSSLSAIRNLQSFGSLLIFHLNRSQLSGVVEGNAPGNHTKAFISWLREAQNLPALPQFKPLLLARAANAGWLLNALSILDKHTLFIDGSPRDFSGIEIKEITSGGRWIFRSQ
jgi:hypothetical protein